MRYIQNISQTQKHFQEKFNILPTQDILFPREVPGGLDPRSSDGVSDSLANDHSAADLILKVSVSAGAINFIFDTAFVHWQT